MLAFLNACQTAESGSGGSFLDVLHSFGFTGAIATERQTIDNFANEFGLKFLQGFLREGKPLGELLHGLRLESAPLGLLYGAHCPPEIRVRCGDAAADIPAPLPIHESGPVSGVPLGMATLPAVHGAAATADRTWPAPRKAATTAPPLPEDPYRSLAFYDWKDRALFTGRDADVVRFAATLDRPDTRILILHGESGIGKRPSSAPGSSPIWRKSASATGSSVGPTARARIIQPAKDLLGMAAEHLLDATARMLHYQHARGRAGDSEPSPADRRGHRGAGRFRRRSARRCGAIRYCSRRSWPGSPPGCRTPWSWCSTRSRRSSRWPRRPRKSPIRDHALRMLQRVVDVRADVKLIISLRTEYYGRLLDHLRAGRRDLTGVRDDLLRDFSRSALIEAITRPTSETPGRWSAESRASMDSATPRASPRRSPTASWRCARRTRTASCRWHRSSAPSSTRRKRTQPGSDGVITREDLDAIKGVEGGLKTFAEDALVRSLHLGPADREAFKGLFSQLYSRQPDGTLTTWLMPRKSLEDQWDRPTPFADMLEAAKSVRLMREDELADRGERAAPILRLGHDALAKVAAAWKAEIEENQRLEEERTRRLEESRKRLKQRRRLAGFAAFSLIVAGLFGWLGLKANHEAKHALIAEKKAKELARLATTAQEDAERERDHSLAAEARSRARRRTPRKRLRRPGDKSESPR